MILAALSPTPLISVWVAVPLGGVMLLLLAGHVTSLRHAEMPESRRRIRQANGMVMMFTVPCLTYALAVVAPAQTQKFVLAWSIAAMLITSMLALAIVDVFNTLRLHRAARAELKDELRAARAEAERLRSNNSAESSHG